MARVGSQVKVSIFYAPFDEILETCFYLGTTDPSVTEPIATTYEWEREFNNTWMNDYLDALTIALSNTVTLIGWKAMAVGDKVTGPAQRIINRKGNQAGNALPNNSLAIVDFTAQVPDPDGPNPTRLWKGGQRISGLAIGSQNSGVWTNPQIAIFNAVFDAMFEDFSFSPAQQTLKLCTAPPFQETIFRAQLNPVVGRMNERVGNRAQGRPSRVVPAPNTKSKQSK